MIDGEKGLDECILLINTSIQICRSSIWGNVHQCYKYPHTIFQNYDHFLGDYTGIGILTKRKFSYEIP